MNEKKVIIILPGFEYLRYGTLTIDLVKITAYVNNIKTDIWYLDTANKEYLSTDELVLSKTVEHLLDDKSIYPDTSYLYALLSENLKRVPNGHFYSLNKENVYTLSVFNDYVEYLNCNDFLHDGLGFVKLDNISSNILFIVKFYSKLDMDQNTNEYDDNYVLVDTKTYYYNPLISNNLVFLTVSKADAVPLKYDNTKEEYVNIKLDNNVILFLKDKDTKLYTTWDGAKYLKSSIVLLPEHLQMYSYPHIIFNKDKYREGNYTTSFSIRNDKNVLFYPIVDLIISAEYTDKITPILYSINNDDISDLSKLCAKQKEYFLSLTNYDLREIKATDLHKYGIYYTNLGKRNLTWGLIKNDDTGTFDYHFFDKGPAKIKRATNNMDLGLDAEYRVSDVYLTDYDFYNEWYNRSYIYTDIKGPLIKDSDLNSIHLLTFKCLQNDNTNLSPSLVDNITKYLFIDPYEFSYLYKQEPYISLCNISPEEPLQLRYDDNSVFNLKECPVKLPNGFIGINDTKRIPLSLKCIEWEWDLGFTEGINGRLDFIFPNYILAVDYDDSYLRLSNTSDYSVIPQLSLTDSNNKPYGFYQNTLVESNIINTNFLSIEEEMGVNTDGFCAFSAYINKDFLNLKTTIERDGYYIFNMNGCISGNTSNIYVLKIKNLEVTISYKNPSVLLYIPKGDYTISLTRCAGEESTLYITSLGLYELNLEDPGVNTVLLKNYLEDLKLDTLYYIPNENNLYDYIIFQASYVYLENKVTCYKNTRTTIYPPKEAIQKPVGVYNINKYNAEIVSEKNITNKYNLLGYSRVENDDCKKTIEAITVKIT